MTQEFINQTAHFLAGMLGVLGPIALFGKAKKYSYVREYAIISITAIAAIKEFGYDAWLGRTQSFLGASFDFGIFAAGIASAIILSYFSTKWNWS